jgi:hypothetical protein
VLRRIQIQSNDVGGLGFKIRIINGHVSFLPVRLDAGGPPDAMNRIFAEIQLPCQLPNPPVHRTILGLAPRGL